MKSRPRIVLVVGLGFGDEGKGGVVDRLARGRGIRLTVRFNGGPQAAHHVHTPQGQVHCFSQFGAGTLAHPQAITYLAPTMLVDPLAMAAEAEHLSLLGLSSPLSRLFIHRDALVVTPFHKLINRMREVARGGARHGSVGMGVGEAVRDGALCQGRALRVGDLADKGVCGRKLYRLQAVKESLARRLGASMTAPEPLAGLYERLVRKDHVPRLVAYYHDFIRESGVHLLDGGAARRAFAGQAAIFEGAQGVLLDPAVGFPPFVTKTRTTLMHAHGLLEEWYPQGVESCRLGVLRTYATRHGPGPLVSEGAGLCFPEPHNRDNPWQGPFRTGALDLLSLRYALEAVGGVDRLAVTHLDRLPSLDAICDAYVWQGDGDPALGDDLRLSAQGQVVALRFDPERPWGDGGMSERLWRCRPHLRKMPPSLRTAEGFLQWITSGQGLGVPLGVASSGPGPGDWVDQLRGFFG